jgi:acyl carrier protein
MSELDAERYAQVKKVVCGLLEVDENEITDTGLFVDEYNADSLQAIEILAGLEREFNVVIGQDRVLEMVNLRSVYQVVAETARW